MAWVTITASEIQEQLTQPEYSAATTAATQAGQTATSLTDAIIEDVIEFVRAKTRACPHNTLGDGATIPDEVKSFAIDECVYRLLKRLPQSSRLMDDNRVRGHEDFMRVLADLAACKLAIEQPATASDENTSTGASVETVRYRTTPATRDELRGL